MGTRLKQSQLICSNRAETNFSNCKLFFPYIPITFPRSLNVVQSLSCTHYIVINSLSVKNIPKLGPVAGSMVSANHWLRGIETYTFLWQLSKG